MQPPLARSEAGKDVSVGVQLLGEGFVFAVPFQQALAHPPTHPEHAIRVRNLRSVLCQRRLTY